MANYEGLKALIRSKVYQNNNQEITGAGNQEALLAIANALSAGYQFGGVVEPNDNPGTVDQRIFYIAFQPGIYVNLNNIEITGPAIFYYNTEWHFIPCPVLTLAAFKQELGIDKNNGMSQRAILSALSPINNTSVGGIYPYTTGTPRGNRGLTQFIGIAKYNIVNPVVYLRGGTGTFVWVCTYRLENGTFGLINSQYVAANRFSKLNFTVVAGDYVAAVVDSDTGLSYAYVDSSDGFYLAYGGATGYTGSPFAIISESNLQSYPQYHIQFVVFSGNELWDNLIDSLGASCGYYNKDVAPMYASEQGYTVVIRVPADMERAKLNIAAQGGYTFGIYRYNTSSNKYELIYSKHFDSGIEDYEIGQTLLSGDYVAVVGDTITDSIGFVADASGAFNYIQSQSLLSEFSNADVLSIGGYKIYFSAFQLSVDERLDALEQEQPDNPELEDEFNRLAEMPDKRIGVIRNTKFDQNTLPAGWTAVGYSPSVDGIVSPGSASIDNLLEYSQYSDLDASCVTYLMDATTAPKVLLTRYGKQYPNDGGTNVEIDFANKTCKIYSAAVKGTTPTTVLASFEIPFDFVSGMYCVALCNYAEIYKVSIFGTGEIVNFYYDSRKYSGNPGRPHDNYGIVHLGGSYKIKQIVFSSQLSVEPDVLVVGDSITEADTIRTQPNGGFRNRWAGLLSDKTKVSIWAQGGNTSTNINNDLAMLVSIFKPKKVIYAIGTNDGNYNTWLANCQAFTEAFEQLGTEVIYTTSVLRPAYETEHAKMRAWIKASGKRYVDFCAAMSVDGQCVTNKDLFLPDNLHPTPAGHLQMYKAVIASLPDLINW